MATSELKGGDIVGDAPGKPGLLLVDDHPELFDQLSAILSDDYSVHVASSGNAALEYAQRSLPDLVVADVIMPGLDGIGLLKALRSDSRTQAIPVILLSGQTGDDARLRGFEVGAHSYLSKPFTLRELQVRIRAALEGSKPRDMRTEPLVRHDRPPPGDRATILESITDAFYALDAQWRFTYVNQHALSLFRRDRQQLLGEVFWDVFPVNRGTVLEEHFRRALLEQRAVKFEYLSPVTDGYIEVNAYPMPGGLAVNFQNISERKRAEQVLREREEALSRAHAELESHATELMRFNRSAVGREMRIIELKGEVNGLAERLGEQVRYALELEPEPEAPPALYRPEGEALMPLDAIVRTESLHERPSRPMDHALENRALGVLISALADSPATILQTLAEKVLEVLDAGSAGLSLLTNDRQRFYWAAIAGQWSPHLGGGTPRDFGPCGDVLDRGSPLLFTHWERRYPYLAEATPLAEEALLVPIPVQGSIVGTIWVIAHDERKFDLEDLRVLESLARFASAAYQTREFLGAVEQRRAAMSLLEDAIHARQLAEDSNRKLLESERALREADRRKTEFLALLGHELRNPLSPISTSSELLSRVLADNPRVQPSINVIKRQTAHLTRLVDDLLDVGRITQGRIQLQRGPLDLAAVIAQAVETVEPQAREKQHRISVASSGEPLYVNGDFTRLVQCVVNVLTNAIKYTDSCGTIQVELRDEGNCALIEVSDSGAGISPELLPHVFELFVQSDRTLDRAEGGLGVGLTVLKRLIEMHGGQVAARSAGLGQGSTFEIRLPRIENNEAPGDIAAPSKAPSRRVFIVDDNADAADSLSSLLSFAGHESQVAYGSREALERIESFQPDVALVDIGLPEIDGYELAARLRALPTLSDMRLVAITGYGQPEDQQRARECGFDGHLVKPVDLAALERTLAGFSSRTSVTGTCPV